jgi:hypothetical protein
MSIPLTIFTQELLGKCAQAMAERTSYELDLSPLTREASQRSAMLDVLQHEIKFYSEGLLSVKVADAQLFEYVETVGPTMYLAVGPPELLGSDSDPVNVYRPGMLLYTIGTTVDGLHISKPSVAALDEAEDARAALRVQIFKAGQKEPSLLEEVRQYLRAQIKDVPDDPPGFAETRRRELESRTPDGSRGYPFTEDDAKIAAATLGKTLRQVVLEMLLAKQTEEDKRAA